MGANKYDFLHYRQVKILKQLIFLKRTLMAHIYVMAGMVSEVM